MLGGPEATVKFPERLRVLEQLFLQIARSQRASDGATVELQPPQVMVPGMVIPQALAGPLQALPRGILAGATALQPLQPITPEFVEPQLFAAEVQAVPYPDGRAGAPTLQAPGDPRGLTIPNEVHVRPSAFASLSPHQTPIVSHTPYSGVPLH